MKDEEIGLEIEQVETLFGVKVVAKDLHKVANWFTIRSHKSF